LSVKLAPFLGGVSRHVILSGVEGRFTQHLITLGYWAGNKIFIATVTKLCCLTQYSIAAMIAEKYQGC
jgi:hypothetical protein